MTEIHIHINPPQEGDPEYRIGKLEGALSLAMNSREFNRKRVVELEDELARLKRDPAFQAAQGMAENYARQRDQALARVVELEDEVARLTEARDHGADEVVRYAQRVVGLEKSLAESREMAGFKNGLMEDLHTRLAEAQTRVAELERSLDRSIARENKMETDTAEEHVLHRQTLAARDQLLTAATFRIEKARQVLTESKVTEARDRDLTTRGAVMADAIGRALNLLTSLASEQA